MPNAKADYTNVPTVVFSHPVIGTIGLTEEEAKEQYGAEKLKIYNSSFVNLWYGPFRLHMYMITDVLCVITIFMYRIIRAYACCIQAYAAVYITLAIYCLHNISAYIYGC